MIDRARLAGLLDRERAEFLARNPLSYTAYQRSEHLFGRVPMTWMNKAAAGFPVYLATARGARVTDIDGHDYVDLCLGDTAAMAGHSPRPTVEAVQRRFAELGGASAMLPTEDAEWVGAELTRRFGMAAWSFSLTATDANRCCTASTVGRGECPAMAAVSPRHRSTYSWPSMSVTRAPRAPAR